MAAFAEWSATRIAAAAFTSGFEFTDIEGPGSCDAFPCNSGKRGAAAWLRIEYVDRSMQTSKINGDRIRNRATIRAAALPGVGIFFMRGAQFLIPKGWNMVWKTQALK